MTHRSMVELGQAPRDPKYAMHGEQVHVPGRGHGAMMIGAPPGRHYRRSGGVPGGRDRAGRQSLPTKEQLDVAYETRIGLTTVFPNFSIHNPIRRPDHHYEGSVPMMAWRTWNPIAPGKISISSYFLVEKDTTDEFKQLSKWSYMRSFGISGTFEQDDAEIWTHIARNAGTFSGRRHAVNHQMGVDLETDTSWPGPGVMYDCVDVRDRRRVGLVCNPRIARLPAARSETAIEGCLSLTGASLPVTRPNTAVCRGQDQFGEPVSVRGTGVLARCLPARGRPPRRGRARGSPHPLGATGTVPPACPCGRRLPPAVACSLTESC